MSLRIVSSSTLGVRPDATNNLNGGSFQQDALCTRKGQSSPTTRPSLSRTLTFPPSFRPYELTSVSFPSSPSNLVLNTFLRLPIRRFLSRCTEGRWSSACLLGTTKASSSSPRALLGDHRVPRLQPNGRRRPQRQFRCQRAHFLTISCFNRPPAKSNSPPSSASFPLDRPSPWESAQQTDRFT